LVWFAIGSFCSMTMRGSIWKLLWFVIILLLGFAASAWAQEPPAQLTLEDALQIARGSNPVFLSARNDRGPADWRLREAYGALVPGATASAGARYLAAGASTFGIFTASDIGLGSTAYYFSDYSLSLNWSFSGETLWRLASRRAERRAAEARVDAADFTLVTSVTRSYLAALRARDSLDLAARERARAEENLELVRARAEVGLAATLEVRQAEVQRGRAEVSVLNAESGLRAANLRLIEQLGVEQRQDPEIALTSTFAVFEPTWVREDLVRLALANQPQLRSLVAEERARSTEVRVAASGYLPTVQVSAGWSGFTREAVDRQFLLGQARSSATSRREDCEFLNAVSAGLTRPLEGYPQDCSRFALTGQQESQILQSNAAFPFDFTPQPFGVSLRVSLPVFQGFSRERQLEEARAAADDAEQARREAELRIRADVASALDALVTQGRVVGIEETNRQAATEQLELARERYRLGIANFLEVLDAESTMAAAERAYHAAVYRFHEALVELEALVGQSLRP